MIFGFDFGSKLLLILGRTISKSGTAKKLIALALILLSTSTADVQVWMVLQSSKIHFFPRHCECSVLCLVLVLFEYFIVFATENEDEYERTVRWTSQFWDRCWVEAYFNCQVGMYFPLHRCDDTRVWCVLPDGQSPADTVRFLSFLYIVAFWHRF